MRKLIWLFMMTLVLAGLLAGCTTEATPADTVEPEAPAAQESIEDEGAEETSGSRYPMVITDSNGRAVTIEEKPERVVSVAPSITETIFALDRADLLVGRTDYCDYPAEVSEIDSVGLLSDPSLETITALDPDLIIASTHFKEEVLHNLEDLGFTVVVLYGPSSFEGAYETIEKVGTVLDASDKADELIAGMQATVAEVTERVSGLEKPPVYYVVGFGEYGDYTATGDTFISDMIAMAGGENVAADATGWKYSLETLMEKDPEVVFISAFGDVVETFSQTEGYKELSAVENNRVLPIDNNTLDRQGPRLAEGLESMARLIHPGAFE